jgi:hypothetical protein
MFAILDMGGDAKGSSREFAFRKMDAVSMIERTTLAISRPGRCSLPLNSARRPAGIRMDE